MYYAVCCCNDGGGGGGGGGEFPCSVCSDTPRYLKIDVQILAQRVTDNRWEYETSIGFPSYRGFIERTTIEQSAVANGLVVWDTQEPNINQAILTQWSNARIGLVQRCTFQKLNTPTCSLSREETASQTIDPIVSFIVHSPPFVPGSNGCLHSLEPIRPNTCYIDVSIRIRGEAASEYDVQTDCDNYGGDLFGVGTYLPPSQVFIQRFRIAQSQDGRCGVEPDPTGPSCDYLFGYGSTDYSFDERSNFFGDYGFQIGVDPIGCDFLRPYTTRYEFDSQTATSRTYIRRTIDHTRSFVFTPYFDDAP